VPANYQSLYRRFRPQRFSEVLGQDHVTRALRAAVASDTVGHAYLFSGPRGTGKTSTARILAKALNCEHPVDGEPCLACGSCVAIASGASGEIEELDAASNSGVDAMRWLIQTVATAGAGRWKVYIIDEVHMLSTAASNALLKTLEEPPPHVIFILATTNPQKVLQTVVSRTQHFEFHLLDASTAGEVVDDIAARTGVELSAATRQWVLRRGRGSARDTLSVLEQVLALDQVIPEVDSSIEHAVASLLDLDAPATVLAVESLLGAGNDPLWVVSEILVRLKDQFLANLRGQGGPYPLARITKAMETLGRLSVGVRDALDPGVVLEAVLVQLIADARMSDDLEERVRKLEASLRGDANGLATPVRAVTIPERDTSVQPKPEGTPAPRSSKADLQRLRGAIGRPSTRGGNSEASPAPDDRSPSREPVASSPTVPAQAMSTAHDSVTTRINDEMPNAETTSEAASSERETIDPTAIGDTALETPTVDQDGGARLAAGGLRDETPDVRADPVPLQQVTPMPADTPRHGHDTRVPGHTRDEASRSLDPTPTGPKPRHSPATTQSSPSVSQLERDAPRGSDADRPLAAQKSIGGATPRGGAAGERLDRAATEHLRSLIQAEWLDRFVLAFEQRNLRTWIRDTRLVVIDAGEIGIVLDHETRRKKLEPYFDEIVATMRQLYGANIAVRMLLESETDDAGPTEAPEVEEPEEMLVEPDDVSTPAESTQRFSEDAIVANVTDVFPGARLIQGEL
jgi:DNA polymerase-3 subunit gamma/tau